MVGTMVLPGMSLVKTPLVVSIPMVRGQTLKRTTPSTPASPERILPWMAAPYATVRHVLPLDAGVLEHLLDGFRGLAEEIDVEFLELGVGEGIREVIVVLEGLDLELGRHLARQSTLGFLNLLLELGHGALEHESGTRKGG
jgi:hypothetical protein